MISTCQMSGLRGIAGRGVKPSGEVLSKGTVKLEPDTFGKPQPVDIQRNENKPKGFMEPDGVEPKGFKKMGIMMNDDWMKHRVRGNQNGFKAVEEGIHGTAWYPVSNMEEEKEDTTDIKAAQVNIQSATFENGYAELTKDPKSLGSKKVLLRAPGVNVVTSSTVHDGEIIVDAAGRQGGYTLMKLKM